MAKEQAFKLGAIDPRYLLQSEQHGLHTVCLLDCLVGRTGLKATLQEERGKMQVINKAAPMSIVLWHRHVDTRNSGRCSGRSNNESSRRRRRRVAAAVAVAAAAEVEVESAAAAATARVVVVVVVVGSSSSSCSSSSSSSSTTTATTTTTRN